MNIKETLRNGGVLLALLLLASSAALWPTIKEQFSGASTQVEREVETITLSLPMEIGGAETITLTALQTMGILLGIVAALVGAAGIGITVIYTMLSWQVSTLAEDEQYQAHLSELDALEKLRLKELGKTRPVSPAPEHKMPRWSRLSTSAIALLFITFFAMLINSTFVPEGEYMIGSSLVSSSLTVVGGIFLIGLLLVLWRIRPGSLARIDDTDGDSIPWDFIWVLVSGLLVVGLGIGVMVFFKIPV